MNPLWLFRFPPFFLYDFASSLNTVFFFVLVLEASCSLLPCVQVQLLGIFCWIHFLVSELLFDFRLCIFSQSFDFLSGNCALEYVRLIRDILFCSSLLCLENVLRIFELIITSFRISQFSIEFSVT